MPESTPATDAVSYHLDSFPSDVELPQVPFTPYSGSLEEDLATLEGTLARIEAPLHIAGLIPKAIILYQESPDDSDETPLEPVTFLLPHLDSFRHTGLVTVAPGPQSLEAFVQVEVNLSALPPQYLDQEKSATRSHFGRIITPDFGHRLHDQNETGREAAVNATMYMRLGEILQATQNGNLATAEERPFIPPSLVLLEAHALASSQPDFELHMEEIQFQPVYVREVQDPTHPHRSHRLRIFYREKHFQEVDATLAETLTPVYLEITTLTTSAEESPMVETELLGTRVLEKASIDCRSLLHGNQAFIHWSRYGIAQETVPLELSQSTHHRLTEDRIDPLGGRVRRTLAATDYVRLAPHVRRGVEWIVTTGR